jgi:hypothetical protein
MLVAVPMTAPAQEGKGKCQNLRARCALQVRGEATGNPPNPRQPQMFGCNPATERWTVSASAASQVAWQKFVLAGSRKPPACR